MMMTAKLREGRRGGERGSGGGASLTLLILVPAIFVIVFGGIYIGFRMYGSNLALDAANAGARAAAVLPVSLDRGRQAAQDFLDHDAAGTLTDTSVSVAMAGSSVVVIVSGRTAALPGRVTQQAELVVEVAP